MSELKCQIITEESLSFDLSFKIIIVGDSGVGKSCLSIKASRNYFEDFYSPTVGFEFLTFNVKVEDQNIKLQIWDTCGQEVYRSLISSFYRSASLAIIVYSIDNENSFNSIEIWLNELKTKGNPDINIFLIGNKADLEDKRVITKDMANDLCDSHNINFFLETSAKTGFNTKNIFIEAAKLLYEQHMKYKDRISRPESCGNIIVEDEKGENNVESLELADNDNEDKNHKKGGCCF